MVKVAQIINTHALKGECKLYLYTDEAKKRFKKGNILYIDKEKPLKVKSFRIQKNLGYAFFEGIDDINQAEALKTKDLWMKEEDLEELEEDEFYYHELNGCKVLNEEEQLLGTVVDILETGANLVLRVDDGKKGFLVPFVKAIVKDVNLDEKKMIIHDMEGLR